MRNLLFILLLFFSADVMGQISQPILLGSADWKITNAHATPEYLPAISHKRKMTKTINEDTKPALVSRKINPGTETISNKPFQPKTGTFISKGKKISPFKTENAPPLLTRDNQEFNVSYTDRDHGFIANSAIGITEDNEHNIWMATELGLIKYDGYHYQLYNQKSGLPGNDIVTLVFDAQQRLWVATEKGLYYIKHDSLFTVESKEIDFRNLRCRNIKIDHLQRIWICTWENGAICLSDNRINIYDSRGGLANNHIFSVLVDQNENIFLLSGERGITILQKDRVLRMFHRANRKDGSIFLSIDEDENGIWIGGFECGLINLAKKDTIQYSMFGKYQERLYDIKKTKGGLWLSIYGSGLYFFSPGFQMQITESNGLRSQLSYFLFEDSYHNIWISDLAYGFSRLNENALFLQSYQNKMLGRIGNIVDDNKNGRWIFTLGAGAIYQKGKYITRYTCRLPDGTAIMNYPQQGIMAKDGTLWMGSYGDGIIKGEDTYFTDYELFKDPERKIIKSVKQDKDQKIWFATSNNGLIMYAGEKFWHYTKKTGLLGDEPSRLFTDATETVFCGFTCGLQRLKGERIETFTISHKEFSEQVTYYYSLTDSNTAFIGTETNGLLIIHNNKAYKLSTQNGLMSDKILSIVQSADKKIWITTDKSIEYFIFDGNKVKEHSIFSQANGSYVINNTIVLLDSDGNPYWQWEGNKKVVFNPTFIAPAPRIPYFSIDSISINNQLQDSAKKLSILPNEKLTIDYTAKYWGRESYLNIQYLLVSARGDSSLRSVDSKGHILISEILPGKYSIYIIANDNGKIISSKALLLHVVNFWYNTWWFRMIMACIVISSIIFYYRKKGNQQIAINQLLATKVEEQTEQLRNEKNELLHSYQVIAKQSNEKDVLLQEINHRVKNNLQFMIAILDMQLRSGLQDDAKNALQSTSNRMNAMSLVHGMLYDSENFGDISIKKYMTELVGHFNSMASVPANRIVFNVTTDEISMPMKPAISLGMIISELISNSFKHAFHNIPHPEITIKITRIGVSDNVSLYYSDNGNGNSNEISPKKGLGNRLINIFSRELNGHYVIDDKNHFSFMLTFNPSIQSEKDA